MERQVYSNLYECLLLSNDKESVLAVAKNEKQPSDAKEIIKDPMYLEFLGLKREASYYERDLESAIITHLQEFLLYSSDFIFGSESIIDVTSGIVKSF